MEEQNAMMFRDRRGGKLDLVMNESDLFMPVRGKRSDGLRMAPLSQITVPKKKAKLDILANDLFLPHRGRRQMARKHFYRIDLVSNPFVVKRNNIDLDMADYFVPNRGKKSLDDTFSDYFVPLRGKKSPPTAAINPAVSWQFQNMISDDSPMIDRHRDLSEVSHKHACTESNIKLKNEIYVTSTLKK